jgi:hypothetical protein
VRVNDPTAQSIEKNLVRVGANIDEPDNPDEVICDRNDPPFCTLNRQSPPPGEPITVPLNKPPLQGVKTPIW